MKLTSTSCSRDGYSIIAAIMMIGFLLVLTASTLNLVLQEMQDGKGRQNYIKAYAGAEWAMELALLEIKQKGYGFYQEVTDSDVFGTQNKEGIVSYDIDSETNSHSGTLDAIWSTDGDSIDIIPLFTIDNTWTKIGGITTIVFDDILGSDIVWNIVGPSYWIWGKWDFRGTDPVGQRTLDASNNFEYDSTENIVQVLQKSADNYLILQNFSNSPMTYKLNIDKNFSKPRAIVKSSSKVGKYSQNIDTTVDNTEFLGILKYSVYSWD